MHTRPNTEIPLRPYIGHGVGLRRRHYDQALRESLPVDWVEVVTENHLGGGGRPAAVLERLRRDMPIVMHGVSMGIASVEPPRPEYLAALRGLIDRWEPAWVSDHLCWTRMSSGGGPPWQSHDLLPFGYKSSTLDFVVSRVQQVQDQIGRVLVLENPSSYLGFHGEDMQEAEFLETLCRRSGCRLLLDLNNIVVCAANHGVDPEAYVDALSPEHIWQFHLANHTDRGHWKFDDHRGPVPDAVWRLYQRALRRFGHVSSLVEWDSDVPEWEVLKAQSDHARQLAEHVLGADSVTPNLASVGSDGFTGSAGLEPQAVPSDLLEMQQLFWRMMAWPTGVRAFLKQAGVTEADAFERHFKGSARFELLDRAEVYAEAYFWRIHEVLQKQLPVVEWAVGSGRFQNLCTDYLLANPSISEDLGQVGRRMPEFLRQHKLAVAYPWLVDFARVDLALVELIDVVDAPALKSEALEAVPPERWAELKFGLNGTTRLLSCDWSYQEAAEMRAKRQSDHRPQPKPGTTLVWRRGLGVEQRALGVEEAGLLRAIEAGKTFAELCEGLVQSGGAEAPARVVAYLRRWLDDQLLTSNLLAS